MKVPALKLGDYLIASVRSSLSDTDLLELKHALLADVSRLRSVGLIVDVTALDAIDSYATRILRDIAYVVRLRGAELVIVGIQPQVALTMVRFGLLLEDVTTTLDLEEGLAYLDRKTRRRRGMPRGFDERTR